jgi:hypothetical protein
LTSQTAAATSASSASTSASSALTSATTAATSYDEFDDRYLGAKASPPTVDNDGNALLTGALYWNTGVNKMYVWSGSAWTEISSSADIIAYKYTVAGGATSVSGADDNGLTLTYSVGKEQVYINGVLQVRGSDYTATTGSSITGISAMIASDIVTVLAFTSFSVSDTYTQAQADAKFFQTANAFLAGKNKIINGDFSVNQRNFTSTTTHLAFGFDRWFLIAVNGTSTFSAETFTPGTAPVSGYESANFARLVSTGQTLTSARTALNERIEDVRVFAGQTATISFWAKASSGTPSVAVNIGQIFGSGGSSPVEVDGQKTAITTSWARYSLTFTIPSMSGKTIGTGSYSQWRIYTSAGSDFNTSTASLGIQSATIDFWGVQVEYGSEATPFQTATGTIQGELAACQRYYYRQTFETAAQRAGSGFCLSATSASIQFPFLVEMRTRPTALEQTGTATDYSVSVATDNYVASAVPTFTGATKSGSTVQISVASGFVAGQGCLFRNVNTNTYLGWSAEL